MINSVKINLETGMWIEDMRPEFEIPMVLNWPTDTDGCPIQPEVPEGEDVSLMYIPDPQYKPQPRQGEDYTYWPKWDFELNAWTEGGTAPEPAVPESSPEDQLRADVDYLAMMMEVDL